MGSKNRAANNAGIKGAPVPATKSSRSNGGGNWWCGAYNVVVLSAVVIGAIAAISYWYQHQSVGSSGSGAEAGGAMPPVLSGGAYPMECARPERSLSKSDRTRYYACGELGVSHCGRVVIDRFLSSDEIRSLRSIADTGMSVTSGGSGGPTVLDLVSGAVSKEDRFVDVYKSMAAAHLSFNHSDLAVYRTVTDRVRKTIALHLSQLTVNTTAAAGGGGGGVSSASDALQSRLVLTKPSFFTRITNAAAVTKHDEYWHDHIDRVQYGTFAVTALLYLNDL